MFLCYSELCTPTVSVRYPLPPSFSTCPPPVCSSSPNLQRAAFRFAGKGYLLKTQVEGERERIRKSKTYASNAWLFYYACFSLSHCFLEKLKISSFVILTCNSHFPVESLKLQPQPLKEEFDASFLRQALSNSEYSNAVDLAPSELVEGPRKESRNFKPELTTSVSTTS